MGGAGNMSWHVTPLWVWHHTAQWCCICDALHRQQCGSVMICGAVTERSTSGSISSIFSLLHWELQTSAMVSIIPTHDVLFEHAQYISVGILQLAEAVQELGNCSCHDMLILGCSNASWAWRVVLVIMNAVCRIWASVVYLQSLVGQGLRHSFYIQWKGRSTLPICAPLIVGPSRQDIINTISLCLADGQLTVWKQCQSGSEFHNSAPARHLSTAPCTGGRHLWHHSLLRFVRCTSCTGAFPLHCCCLWCVAWYFLPHVFASSGVTCLSCQCYLIPSCCLSLPTAEKVYGAPHWLNCVLMVGRVAARNTLDTYVDWFLGHKLDSVLQEHRAVKIINLLKGRLCCWQGSLTKKQAFLTCGQTAISSNDWWISQHFFSCFCFRHSVLSWSAKVSEGLTFWAGPNQGHYCKYIHAVNVQMHFWNHRWLDGGSSEEAKKK